MKLSQSNFNLRSPDSDSVRSYLIATVKNSFLHQSVVIFKRIINVELTFLINLGPMFIADYRVVMNFLFVFRF